VSLSVQRYGVQRRRASAVRCNALFDGINRDRLLGRNVQANALMKSILCAAAVAGYALVGSPAEAEPLASVLPDLTECTAPSLARKPRPIASVRSALVGKRISLRGTLTLGRQCTDDTMIGCLDPKKDCCANSCLTAWVLVDSNNPTTDGYRGIEIQLLGETTRMQGKVWDCHRGPAARLDVVAAGILRIDGRRHPNEQGFFYLDYAEVCRVEPPPTVRSGNLDRQPASH